MTSSTRSRAIQESPAARICVTPSGAVRGRRRRSPLTASTTTAVPARPRASARASAERARGLELLFEPDQDREGPQEQRRRLGPAPSRSHEHGKTQLSDEQPEESHGTIGAARQAHRHQGADRECHGQEKRVERRGPLLARRAEGEECRERQQAHGRHLEARIGVVGLAPAEVQDQRAEEGQGKGLGPGLSPIEPDRPGSQQHQIEHEAGSPIRSGGQERRGEVAADPRHCGEESGAAEVGHGHGAHGHHDHHRSRKSAGHEAVERVGGEGRDVETGEARRRQPLAQGTVLPVQQAEPGGHEPEAEDGSGEHAAHGAHPFVLPRVADEQGEEDHDRQPPGAHEDPGAEVRGEVCRGLGGGSGPRCGASHWADRGRWGWSDRRGRRRRRRRHRLLRLSGALRSDAPPSGSLEPRRQLRDAFLKSRQANERSNRKQWRHRSQESHDAQHEDDRRLHAHLPGAPAPDDPATDGPRPSSGQTAPPARASPRSGSRGE